MFRLLTTWAELHFCRPALKKKRLLPKQVLRKLNRLNLSESFSLPNAKKKVLKGRFDRSGYKYHGRVKSLADAAREGGLKF